MQGIGRCVEPDVARDPARGGGRVQPFEVGALVEIAALGERAQELRFQGGRWNGHSGRGEIAEVMEAVETTGVAGREYRVSIPGMRGTITRHGVVKPAARS